jgi:pimeloyl-ACP methyl ester carboxylesterase
VLSLIESGAREEAARLFVDAVALGPGAWEQLPQPARATFVDNADSFLDEQRTPGWDDLDLAGLARASDSVAVRLSQGTQRAPAPFGRVLDVIESAVHVERRVSIDGAGHVPHLTHPQLVADHLVDVAKTASSRT